MGEFSVFLRSSIVIFLLAIGISACFAPPEFPNEPQISFNDISFKKGATQFDPDSLILTINFQDGDGDLGLRSQGADTGTPYHDLWFFQNYNDHTRLVTLADRNTPEYDTLPPYEFPYLCTNYSISGTDTFYVQPNEFHYNIHVKYFVKKNGVYNEFDWLTAFDPICGETFNGRFPLLNDIDRSRPLEGKLKYKMKSAGFELLFRLDTLKLDVYIIDRALNVSNTISTPDFVLQDILAGG